MQSKWSNSDEARYLEKYREKWGEDLAQRIYLAVLIGSEESLVLHGGGNTSVKTDCSTIFGESIPVLYVKASGQDMAAIEPEGYLRLNLEYLRRLRMLAHLSEEEMLYEFQTHLLDARSIPPSIETLVHAFLPGKYVDHTHADAVLTLTNQPDGRQLVREALGPAVPVLDYVEPGFKLALAAAAAFDANPGSKGMVWMRHGLVTWGRTARESYEATVELVTMAEQYISRRARRSRIVSQPTPLPAAEERFERLGPVIRGLLARPSGDPDRPHTRCILQPLITREALDFVDSDGGREMALTAPITCDHLVRTKPYPLWLAGPRFDDPEAFRAQASQAIGEYAEAYTAYVERNRVRMPRGSVPFDPMPRVLLIPGLGAVCAGRDAHAAGIVRDITAHTLAVKAQVAGMGTYLGIPESDLFDMEYRGLQLAKVGSDNEPPLAREVALVTGAAGAIGSGIAEELLRQGCHVAVTDSAADRLEDLLENLRGRFRNRVMGVVLDVTDTASVAEGFRTVIRMWGGIDLVVINQGLALVSPLADMDLQAFRRLERVNVEGTLLVLAESARHFRLQQTGGDVVLVSTKNVFAPGAQFGAYSATKSAAHQLARIASLELAEDDVRVNMVSPDAVFSHGERKSGLWAEVGPSRMAARGLDPQGLEEYYRNRNLLKAKVTAQHVARAVLFFASRQTPTTGATLPVDGGLPDSTPR